MTQKHEGAMAFVVGTGGRTIFDLLGTSALQLARDAVDGKIDEDVYNSIPQIAACMQLATADASQTRLICADELTDLLLKTGAANEALCAMLRDTLLGVHGDDASFDLSDFTGKLH